METLFPLLSFIVVSSITPGPNNLLLATTGMRFGFRAAIPQVIGIHFGFYSLLALCAFGLNQVIIREPKALLFLKVFGSLYLFYLAWKIIGIRLSSSRDNLDKDNGKPMTIFESFVFQFSNPKAWMMTVTGVGIVLPLSPTMLWAVIYLCLGFMTLGLLCNLSWVLIGSALKTAYGKNIYRIWINAFLAGLTVFTVTLFWAY